MRFLLFCLLLSLLVAILSLDPEYRYQQIIFFSDNVDAVRTAQALLPQGDSFLFFPYWGVKKALLHAEPSLASVTFVPVFSNGFILEVLPQERDPIALLENRNHVAYLDENGVVFPFEKYFPNLFQIELPGKTPFFYGEKLESPYDSQILKLLSVLNNFPQMKFSYLRVDSKGDWRFFTKEGVCVKIGHLNDLQGKLSLLPVLFRVISTKKLQVASIDVRMKDMPVIAVKKQK